MLDNAVKNKIEKILYSNNGVSISIIKNYIIKSLWFKKTQTKAYEAIINCLSIDTLPTEWQPCEDMELFKDVCVKLNDIDVDNKDIFKLYEYLLMLCATNGGKFTGEYYTPTEVSMLVSLIAFGLKFDAKTIYDPTCGNATLLVNSLNGNKNTEIYGQDINPDSVACASMIIDMMGIKGVVKVGNTLTNDCFKDKKFDIVVSNPPYSLIWDNKGLDNDPRFKDKPLPPPSKADFAFILHSLHHLEDDGVCVCICFPGIFYRGGAEQKVREYLIRNNLVDVMIQLPGNIFVATSIQTTVMVLRKNKQTDDILFIDSSNDFDKGKINVFNNGRTLKILTNRDGTEPLSKLIKNDDVAKNDYNLSVSSYVFDESKKEDIDIKALNKRILELRESNYQKFKELDEFISNNLMD